MAESLEAEGRPVCTRQWCLLRASASGARAGLDERPVKEEGRGAPSWSVSGPREEGRWARDLEACLCLNGLSLRLCVKTDGGERYFILILIIHFN